MSEQVIASFVRTHLVDVLVGASEGTMGKGGGPNSQKVAKNSAEIKNGSSTMSVGQKARFDTTPVSPAGDEYTGNDSRVAQPAFFKSDGTSPIIEWSLLIDGKEVMNTDSNPFQLGSYEDNGGCTPTLKLTTQIGGGRHKCEFGPIVNADPNYNGGVAVKGPAAVFYAD